MFNWYLFSNRTGRQHPTHNLWHQYWGARWIIERHTYKQKICWKYPDDPIAMIQTICLTQSIGSTKWPSWETGFHILDWVTWPLGHPGDPDRQAAQSRKLQAQVTQVTRSTLMQMIQLDNFQQNLSWYYSSVDIHKVHCKYWIKPPKPKQRW